MTFSEENIILTLVSSLTAVFSYMFIRRAFWKDEETKEASELFLNENNNKVSEDATKETSEYIGQSATVFGILATFFWLILIYLLNELKK